MRKPILRLFLHFDKDSFVNGQSENCNKLRFSKMTTGKQPGTSCKDCCIEKAGNQFRQRTHADTCCDSLYLRSGRAKLPVRFDKFVSCYL